MSCVWHCQPLHVSSLTCSSCCCTTRTLQCHPLDLLRSFRFVHILLLMALFGRFSMGLVQTGLEGISPFSVFLCFFSAFLCFSLFFIFLPLSPRTRAHNCNLPEKWGLSLRPRLNRPRPEIPEVFLFFLLSHVQTAIHLAVSTQALPLATRAPTAHRQLGQEPSVPKRCNDMQ